jgi:hypothetical protein
MYSVDQTSRTHQTWGGGGIKSTESYCMYTEQNMKSQCLESIVIESLS